MLYRGFPAAETTEPEALKESSAMARIQQRFGISDGGADRRLRQARRFATRGDSALAIASFRRHDSFMPAERAFSLGVVILAAGFSSRMGRPKLLLPWGETSVLGHLIGTWKGLGAEQIAVVRRHDDAELQAELDRIQFSAANRIINPDPDRGMFSSIQCAARWDGWIPALTHWALALGDQPHLRMETLKRLLESAKANPEKVSQPARAGRPRHPVVLPQPLFRELARAKDATLKEFLATQSAGMNPIEITDPGLELDLDRPEDYEAALRLFLNQ
jgi:molybdenum cofactor cytidylyltransferase